MDILDAFLSGKPVEKKVIRGGTTDGRIADKDEIPTYVEDKVPKQTREYAEPFVKKLHEAVLRVSKILFYFQSKLFEVHTK